MGTKWLIRKRLASERRFARLRPRAQSRIVVSLVGSTLRMTLAAGVVFAIAGVYFSSAPLVWTSGVFFVLVLPFYGYLRFRLSRLRRYYSVETLQQMDPFEFESYVVILCNRLGWKLETTRETGDDGADGIGKNPENRPAILQVKRYADATTVGSPEIRNFIGSMHLHRVTSGIFVTTGYFTAPALATVREMGANMEISLVDKDGLIRMLEKAYPKR